MIVSDDLFIPMRKDNLNSEAIVRPQLTFWQEAWLRLRSNKLALMGLVIIILLGVMSTIGPMISGYEYSKQSIISKNQPRPKRTGLEPMSLVETFLPGSGMAHAFPCLLA